MHPDRGRPLSTGGCQAPSTPPPAPPLNRRAPTDAPETRTLPIDRGKDVSKHQVGVSFNWDKVCGCVEPEERDPIK